MKLLPLYLALFFLGAAIGYVMAPQPAMIAGATLPSATAVFETSLQSAITSSATSLTLTANAVRGGGSLSGYNCFTIDEGSAQAETVCGTVASTAVTAISRGISQSTGTSTVAALQFAHRRGANVKITDFPLIQILKAQANGEDTFPNLLKYTAGTACSGSSANAQICDKAYIDGVAVAGASNANETTKGIIELATQIEMASSTALGGTAASLVLQAKYATSSPGYAGLWAVITNNAGKIAQTFFDLTANFNFTGNTYIKNLNASSTVAIGGVNYTYPTTQGAATTTLMNDGTGILTWGRPEWSVIASSTLASAVSTTTVSFINPGTDLHIVVDIPSFSGQQFPKLQFNSDTTGTYSYNVAAVGNNTAVSGTTVGNIVLTDPATFSTSGATCDIKVTNRMSSTKRLTWQCVLGNGNVAYVGGGLWNNSAAQITSVSIGASAAGTISIGSRITVYSSTN